MDTKQSIEAEKRWERWTDLQWMMERPHIVQDSLRMLLGKKLSIGQFRAVYDFSHIIKNSVIKMADANEVNIHEFMIWKEVSQTPYHKWFARCIMCSDGGHFLVQQKVRPAKREDKMPKKLPQFFDDIKFSNFGWIGKQLVCHDYQFVKRAFDMAANVSFREINWKDVRD